MPAFKLLSRSNPKVEKGLGAGFWTFILHLAPAKLSGYEVCAMRTTGCTVGCLNLAGQGGLMAGVSRLTFDMVNGGKVNAVQAARIRKTRHFFEAREAFIRELVDDVARAVKAARRKGLVPVIRLNGTSDIRWETVPCVRDGVTYCNIMEAFPDVQFYDYTKLPDRRGLPANYALTFSLADGNEAKAIAAFKAGMNVAAVFRDKATVARFMASGIVLRSGPVTVEAPMVSGDETDLRFLDPKGCIVGLYAKGNAVKDRSGFVRD
jgi:hypothetical protein